MDIPRPEPPYIMMEIVRPELPFKILKFISFSQRKFITIGRKKEVDVRISEDISVSRIHSIISYDKEKN